MTGTMRNPGPDLRADRARALAKDYPLLSYAEVGRRVGLSRGAARNAIRAGRSRLEANRANAAARPPVTPKRKPSARAGHTPCQPVAHGPCQVEAGTSRAFVIHAWRLATTRARYVRAILDSAAVDTNVPNVGRVGLPTGISVET